MRPSSPKKAWSVRRTLLVLLCVAILPPILVIAGIGYQWFNQRLGAGYQQNLEVARALGNSMDIYFGNHSRHLLSLGNALTELRPYRSADANRLLRNSALVYPSVQGFSFADTNGVVTISSRPDVLGRELRDEPWFGRLRSVEGMVLSSIEHSKTDSTLVIRLGQAVRDPAGGVHGYIYATVVIAQLFTDVVHFERPPMKNLFLLDKAGNMIFVTGSDIYFFSGYDEWQASSKPVIDALASDEAIGLFPNPLNEKTMVAAQVAVGDFGWLAGACSERSAMLRPVLKGLLIAIGSYILIIMVSMGAGLFIASRVIKSLRRFKDHVQAIGRGERGVHCEFSEAAELNELKEAFDAMAAELTESKATLEQRVSERTEELLLYRERLEQMVQERTRELEIVNTRLSREIEVRRQTEQELVMVARFPSDSPSPVMRIDGSGKLLYSNPASSILLHKWRSEIGAMVPSEVMASVGQALHSHSTIETEVTAADRVYALIFYPVPESEFVNVYGHDLTERKRAEESLVRSNRDLEQFAYISSHDLQEPLRMIAGYLDLLSRRYKGRLDKDADDFITFAVDGAMRMQHLITDLLAYSRIGSKDLWMAAIDLNEPLEMAQLNLRGTIESSKAEITHDPLPTATVDLPQMVQLFQNLLSNAMKFRKTGESPRIHVSAVKQGAFWRIGVHDNGIGMEQQYADRIFRVFQRLHTRAEYPGTGIGLAICKRILERHGGRIWVEAEMGKGATFYFTVRE